MGTGIDVGAGLLSAEARDCVRRSSCQPGAWWKRFPSPFPRGAGIAVIATFGIVGITVAAPPDGIAYRVDDLRTRTIVDSAHPEILDRPVRPGSIAKIATLAAALESSVITERSTVVCTRTVIVGTHRLTCSHPDLHRPLAPAEALAHSCNVFFATVAARLPRAALDDALTALGWPRSDPSVPVAEAALGLDGIRIAPASLMRGLERVSGAMRWRPETLAVVRDGLRGAATYGTAAALGERGIDALAKTGTTLAGRDEQGLVVGVTPPAAPTRAFVLLASGAAGGDAAALIADRLKPVATAAVAGSVRLGIARDGGYTVREIPLEEYVAGVLAGEAVRDSTPEALEALAITVRTFALANLGRHKADGFDLCDLTHCQVFRIATAATTHAATATAGRVLLYHGAPASVFYTASCGGRTERPSAVWPGADDPSYLPSRADDACQGAPAWTADLTAGDLLRALHAAGYRGDVLRNMKVLGRSDSGRVARLRLDGLEPGEISGQDLRTVVGRTLGWQHIKSTAFDLKRVGSGYSFSGHGSGHGVGMCVIGAARLGAKGTSAERILARYFPGLQIGAAPALMTSRREPRIGAAPASPAGSAPNRADVAVTPTGPEILVTLPAGDEGERDVVRDLAARARDSLARELGVAVPPRIALRFHPTVESYQRATGQPWYTAAASAANEIHFVPLTVLRERGVLERTLRHEIVHVLTEPVLANRPLWVREGAASYFAGERDPPGARRPRTACPSDIELRQPVSGGALSNAYARATACFARQLESGKKWSDVR